MIAYRQIIDDDLPALREIVRACRDQIDGEADWVARIQVDPPRPGPQGDRTGWVGCADGKPVGFAIADRRRGELSWAAVLPAHRRQGIARQLLRQAEAWLFSHGSREISLQWPAGSTREAAAFFTKLGWTAEESAGRGGMKKTNPRTVIRLEEHLIADPATGHTRLVRVQRGPGVPHRLCLFLDGEHYWRDMDAVPLLNDLVERGAIPPMTFAFVGHVSAAARHEDYTCNERFAQFVSGAVINWIRIEIPHLPAGGNLVVGLSLSGMMATYLAVTHPRQFAGCVSQSGSHWWRHAWFARVVRQHAPLSGRFWLSVGDQETATDVRHPPSGLHQEISQIEGVERAARVVQDNGGRVHHRVFPGGHSIGAWRDDLALALPGLSGEKNRPT